MILERNLLNGSFLISFSREGAGCLVSAMLRKRGGGEDE